MRFAILPYTSPRFILVSILTLLPLLGYCREFRDVSKPIALKRGETEFTIVLESNPSTGYAWYLLPYAKEYIESVSYRYEREKDQLPGGPGEAYWTFKLTPEAVKVPMLLSLSLTYLRHWQPEDAKVAEIGVMTQPE